MLHIPDWAIGVAAICGGLGVMVVLMQLGEGLKQSVFKNKAAAVPAPDQTALDDLQRRVAELEERLDFTERVLAQRPDSEKLAPLR